MPRCKVCNRPVGFFANTCDVCIQNYPKFEALGRAIEECYAIAASIRKGSGEFAQIDLERRMLMTTGAEHCVKRLLEVLEDLKGNKVVERRSAFSNFSPGAGGRKNDV